MSATDIMQAEGDLIPLSSRILQMCYGGEEYIRSVFGTAEITRRHLSDYYGLAQDTWIQVSVEWCEIRRGEINRWIKANNIATLDYYFPMNRNRIWFKQGADAFAFTLKFGIIDK